MVRQYKTGKAIKLDEVRNRTNKTLSDLDVVFIDNDSLLRTQSVIPIYYLTLKIAAGAGKQKLVSREKLETFNALLAQNRHTASEDIASANFEYLEYDRMSQQGTNDAVSLKERTRILCKYLKIPVSEEWIQK